MSFNSVSDFRQNSMVSGSFDSSSQLGTDVPDAVIQWQLDSAQTEIEAALRTHHTLPLATVPAVILDAELVIAAYRLLMTMGIDPGLNSTFLQQRYLEVVGDSSNPASGLLGRIAYGKMSLGNAIDSAAPSPPPLTPVVIASAADRNWYASGIDIRTGTRKTNVVF